MKAYLGYVWRTFPQASKWLAIALFFHLAAAVFSAGFQHYDEHFNIVEFANYKLGKTPEADLNLDFRGRWRAFFLPAVFVGVAKVANLFGVESPSSLMFAFRLTSSLVGYLSLVLMLGFFARCLTRPIYRDWGLVLLSVLWFFPYIHARTSAENWGGSLLCMGIGLLFWPRTESGAWESISRVEVNSSSTGRILGAAILWGLAFQCRYQLGFMIAPGFLWCVLFGRLPLKGAAIFIAGFAFTLLLGLWIDRWGYGFWNPTPWNYYLGLVVSGYNPVGGDPWWSFPKLITLQGAPFVGLLLVLGTLATWVLSPLSFVTWITLPFVVMHASFNQEVRYLYPIAAFTPLFLLLPLQQTGRNWGRFIWLRKLALGFNALFLVVTCLMPTRTELAFYDRVNELKLTSLSYFKRNPFVMAGVKATFYRPKDLALSEIVSWQPLEKQIASSSSPVWLFYEGLELPPEAGKAKTLCRRDYSTLPKLLQGEMGKKVIQASKLIVWSLFECRVG